MNVIHHDLRLALSAEILSANGNEAGRLFGVFARALHIFSGPVFGNLTLALGGLVSRYEISPATSCECRTSGDRNGHGGIHTRKSQRKPHSETGSHASNGGIFTWGEV